MEQSGERNVLELGVKNDGSCDVSEIVNRYTVTNALYFPCGQYLVEKPLVLKNPIRGAGYSRGGRIDGTHTWLVSAIDGDEGVGVIEFGGTCQMTVSDLNIRIHSYETAIRIEPCCQATQTLIDRVGIYNVRSYGLYANNDISGASRPVFAQNMTIMGAGDYPELSTGICFGNGIADNRLSGVEIMGTRVGLLQKTGFVYADNLHFWTGCMAQKDNGSWWKGTRGIVLDGNAIFSATNVYIDSCYYALEQLTGDAVFNIRNIMYWEDSSMGGDDVCKVYDGAFYHAPDGTLGKLTIEGGLIGVSGNDGAKGRMEKVYTPYQNITNVTVKSNYTVTPENLDRICFSDALPVYDVFYRETDVGFCKVADVMALAGTGVVGLELSTETGEVYEVILEKKETPDVRIRYATGLCRKNAVKVVAEEKHVKIYLRNDGATFMVHVRTNLMSTRFRPINFRELATHDGKKPYFEVI